MVHLLYFCLIILCDSPVLHTYSNVINYDYIHFYWPVYKIEKETLEISTKYLGFNPKVLNYL
jgi:hypothetical protein